MYGLLQLKDPPNSILEYDDPGLSSIRPTLVRHLLRIGEFLSTPR